MQAVLYICHGSRVEQAVNEAVSFIEQTKKLVDVKIQEHCFLELAEPSIQAGVNRCVERGATKIAVIPVLLLKAGHAKRDIPEELAFVREKYPTLELSYGEPIGVQEEMIDVLVDRLLEKKHDYSESDVLLVGRGSSDPATIADIETIAKKLEQRISLKTVRTCYLAAAKPKFKVALVDLVSAGNNKIVVLPYILFTGILMQEITEEVKQLIGNDKEIIICNYLGTHPVVSKRLKYRVMETIRRGENHAAMA